MLRNAALLIIVGLFIGACSQSHKDETSSSTPSMAPPPERDINVAEVQFYNDSAIENAIIAQHTLYSYDFVPNSAALNDLGEHDFRVLVEHFRNNPGDLNIRRGPDDSQTLYDARVRLITDRLGQSGIQLGPIADGNPSGNGMTSEMTLSILVNGTDAGSKSPRLLNTLQPTQTKK